MVLLSSRAVVMALLLLLWESSSSLAYVPSDPSIFWGRGSAGVPMDGTNEKHQNKQLPSIPEVEESGPQQDQHRVVVMVPPVVAQRRRSTAFVPPTVGGSEALHTFVIGEALRHTGHGTSKTFRLLEIDSETATTDAISSDAATQDDTSANTAAASPLSLTLVDAIAIPHPGYVRLDERGETVLVSGFAVAGTASLASIAVATGRVTHAATTTPLVWPNEILLAPPPQHTNNDDDGANRRSSRQQYHTDAMIVSDGFLVPTKDNGGVYVVRHHGDPALEEIVALTDTNASNNRWFYHRSVWVDLTGDGRQSLLTARCRTRWDWTQGGFGCDGELVWLECPQNDGTSTTFDPFAPAHTPWKTHVLATGPDVMFAVADMDPTDDTIEVISSQFFAQQVVLQSIQCGPEPKVVFEKVLDTECGHAFSTVLANMDGTTKGPGTQTRVVHSGSTVAPPPYRADDRCFSHVLVTSHACRYLSSSNSGGGRGGGSLLAYKVPKNGPDAWKTEEWTKEVVASDFRVKGRLANLINPGAPGFVYTFHPGDGDDESATGPLIAVAGDCSESAYIYRPLPRERHRGDNDTELQYELLLEIKCGATVGSIGIGYQTFGAERGELGERKSGVTLYIPLYEKSNVLVFDLQGI